MWGHWVKRCKNLCNSFVFVAYRFIVDECIRVGNTLRYYRFAELYNKIGVRGKWIMFSRCFFFLNEFFLIRNIYPAMNNCEKRMRFPLSTLQVIFAFRNVPYANCYIRSLWESRLFRLTCLLPLSGARIHSCGLLTYSSPNEKGRAFIVNYDSPMRFFSSFQFGL